MVLAHVMGAFSSLYNAIHSLGISLLICHITNCGRPFLECSTIGVGFNGTEINCGTLGILHRQKSYD